MRIVVTGGAGFIGSHFSESAVAQGFDVLVLDKLTYAGSLRNLDAIPSSQYAFELLDISDQAKLFAALERFKPNVLINFAAESHVDRSINNPLPFYTSNIIGATNCYEAERKGLVGRIIQISTDEVYGSAEHGSWDESAPLLPRSPYSASKASAELIALSYKTTFLSNLQITRCANNFGPRQGLEKFLPTSIVSCMTGKPIPIYGNGQNRREWLHVSDHVEAIMAILLSSKCEHSVYNIGGNEMSNIDLAREVNTYFGRDSEDFVYIPDRPGHDFRYSVNDLRFSTEFSTPKKRAFLESLHQTIDWYRGNHEWISTNIGVINS